MTWAETGRLTMTEAYELMDVIQTVRKEEADSLPNKQ